MVGWWWAFTLTCVWLRQLASMRGLIEQLKQLKDNTMAEENTSFVSEDEIKLVMLLLVRRSASGAQTSRSTEKMPGDFRS